jgi:Icc-related predicted phosphoesterase
MSNDVAVSVTTFVPTGTKLSSKPSYLVILEDNSGKNKTTKRFITLDKPDLLNGFISVKGFFSELSEEEISNQLSDLLTNTKKELIIEVMFPWHKICSVRSLIFKAK